MSYLARSLSVLTFFLATGCESAAVGEEELAVKVSGDEVVGPSACDGDRFSIPNSFESCCQLGNETWHINPNGSLTHREYLLTPCRDANGNVGCGVGASQCPYGPCMGARNLENGLGTRPSFVFKPTTDPMACGWHVTINGVASWDPEEYTTQEKWEGVEGTCPYTRCLTSGTPATILGVTAVASGATGRVKSVPKGITLTGAGTSSALFVDLDVKLIAEPADDHARARFSGACTATGDYDDDAFCNFRLGPDKTVTVTYECQPGFTCAF